MKRSFIVLSTLLVALFAATAWAGGAKHLASTRAGLERAYDSEWNSYLTYRAFARDADREGMREAATLFRAVAQAELAHAALHASVIRWIGAEPVVESRPPIVESVKENLVAALANEQRETDELYAELLPELERERSEQAIRGLLFARAAESTHAELLTELTKHYALVAAWGDSLAPRWTAKELYVCPTCGRIERERPAEHCPSCYAAAKSLLAVR